MLLYNWLNSWFYRILQLLSLPIGPYSLTQISVSWNISIGNSVSNPKLTTDLIKVLYMSLSDLWTNDDYSMQCVKYFGSFHYRMSCVLHDSLLRPLDVKKEETLRILQQVRLNVL